MGLASRRCGRRLEDRSNDMIVGIVAVIVSLIEAWALSEEPVRAWASNRGIVRVVEVDYEVSYERLVGGGRRGDARMG